MSNHSSNLIPLVSEFIPTDSNEMIGILQVYEGYRASKEIIDLTNIALGRGVEYTEFNSIPENVNILDHGHLYKSTAEIHD